MAIFPETPRPIRFLIAAAISAAGAATMVAILWAMGDIGSDDVAAMVPSAMIGAAISGYVFAGFFGQWRRRVDWLLTIAGAILATGLGSFLGGVCWGLVGFTLSASTSIGPWDFLWGICQAGLLVFMVVMVGVPTDFPMVAGIWVLLMAAVQVMAIRLRRTPDT